MSHLPARRLPQHCCLQHSNPTRQRGTSAFTLVEMLVAMVLTLIMVAAIAEFYAYVGDTVRDGRAMIEMGGQMRAAVQRLKSDFDQITISVVPWSDDGAAQGYFEYREGRIVNNSGTLNTIMATDYDSNGNDIIDATMLEDLDNSGAGNGTNDLLQLAATDLLGDCDDYIAFTIRSNGEPFSGRWYDPNDARHEIVYSQLAEVVWFTAFKDLNDDDTWQWNEPRYLVRRLLLIIPDILTTTGTSELMKPPTAPATDNVFHHNDISARAVDNGTVVRWFPNSFENLGKRENRFGHQWNQPNVFQFPNKLLINSFDHATIETYSLNGDFEGEDVVLSNLLAFDVRVYEPQAWLRQDTDGALPAVNALAPPDVGYLQAGRDNNLSVGTGAYVDLGYGMKFVEQLQKGQNPLTYANAFTLVFTGVPANNVPPIVGNPVPPYAMQPVAGPGITGNALNVYLDRIGYTYDTWSLSYERDGINQDFSADGANGPNTGLTDEGTNGVDDADTSGNYANGVDDFNERETRPPYSQALRGLQVKIRMYESGTRQMRQATVTTDFLTE